MHRLPAAVVFSACLLLTGLAAAPASAAPPTSGYIQSIHVEKRFAFVQGADWHLYVNYWDGFSWRWADQGLPPGVQYISSPSAISYADAAGIEHISVFVRGSGHLYENYWDGAAWRWYDHGLPPGLTSPSGIGGPAPVTYRDQSGVQHIYVFVCGERSGVPTPPHLFVRWWNGASWQWADQGVGCPGTADVAAVGYPVAESEHLFAFTTNSAGHLLVNYWDGASWRWSDQGLPPNGINLVNGPAASAVTYADPSGVQHLDVFAEGGDYHVYDNQWTGSTWRWLDQGRPGSSVYVEHPAALTYRDTAGLQWLNVYVGDAAGSHLFNNWFDGSLWRWNDQGMPPGGSGEVWPAGATYLDSVGNRRIDVFSTNTTVGGVSGHLALNYWDGYGWHWSDQGLAPNNVALVNRPAVISY